MAQKKLVSPFEPRRPITVKIAAGPKDAESWRAKGYTPVECCFGECSIVDDLELDHHGPFSDREGVAIRAYRDCFGSRAENPKFVTTGFPDEDATWAMCAAAGILPHPSNADRFPDAPPAMARIARQNLLHVAELINHVDVNPDEAITLVDTYWGRLVLSWRQQAHPTQRDLLAWMGGLDRWRCLCSAQTDDMINVAVNAQRERLEEVGSARSIVISEQVVVVDFSTLGPNSAFYRVWLERFPVVVAFIGGPTGFGTCSFVTRSVADAEQLFGRGGLRAAYPALAPGGCGGRENIGGSNRTAFVNWEHARGFGQQLAALHAQCAAS